MLSLNQSIFMEGGGARPLSSLKGYAGKRHCPRCHAAYEEESHITHTTSIIITLKKHQLHILLIVMSCPPTGLGRRGFQDVPPDVC